MMAVTFRQGSLVFVDPRAPSSHSLLVSVLTPEIFQDIEVLGSMSGCVMCAHGTADAHVDHKLWRSASVICSDCPFGVSHLGILPGVPRTHEDDPWTW
jgi:hypothetical protein